MGAPIENLAHLIPPGGILSYNGYMREAIKKQALRRLKIVEGQIRGLQKMVEQEKYCIDVINQSLAVKEALSSFENLMLENHLSTHVIEQIKQVSSGLKVKYGGRVMC